MVRYTALRYTKQAMVRASRRAFTLVEMLVAMALTLILVYAIAEFYAYVGDIVRDGRAMIEMGGELRAASTKLKEDLNRLTVQVKPGADDGTAPGYLEYFEGAASDIDSNGDGDPNLSEDQNGNGSLDTGEDTNGNTTLDIGDDTDSDGKNDFTQFNVTTMLGDMDDVLAFTIRSNGEPFVGQTARIKVDGTGQSTGEAFVTSGRLDSWSGTSSIAEVAWWTGFADRNSDNSWDIDENRFLCRRQLLVNSSLNQVHPGDTNYSGAYFFRVPEDTFDTIADAYQQCDVSLQFVTTVNNFDYYAARSFNELSQRENRFMHQSGFPGTLDLNPFFGGDPSQNRGHANNNQSLRRWVLDDNRRGEDIMLSNLLAFDVRAYDPYAWVVQDAGGNTALVPGDPAFKFSLTQIGSGAYVDLGYDPTPDTTVGADADWTAFGGATNDDYSHFSARSRSLGPGTGSTYDTWSTSYDKTRNSGKGTNGIDDDDMNGVDDPGERVTTPPSSPPYPYPLRGIQVRIRLYEPSTRQTRQATVVADFLPE